MDIKLIQIDTSLSNGTTYKCPHQRIEKQKIVNYSSMAQCSCASDMLLLSTTCEQTAIQQHPGALSCWDFELGCSTPIYGVGAEMTDTYLLNNTRSPIIMKTMMMQT